MEKKQFDLMKSLHMGRRHALLIELGELEKFLGISPTTAEIRAEWKVLKLLNEDGKNKKAESETIPDNADNISDAI